MEFLRESVLDPNKKIVKSYEKVTVDSLGRLVSGRLLEESDTSVSLLVYDDAGFRVEAFPLDDLEQFDDGRYLFASAASPMPAYGDVLIETELADLLEYLKALR